MTIFQTLFSFVALVLSAHLAFELRLGRFTPILSVIWALSVVFCAISFAGVSFAIFP